MFPQGCHAFTLAVTPVFLDANLTETYKKKWYDSAENAATKTRLNVKYSLMETCDRFHVSTTVFAQCVYIKFPFTDS